MSVDASDHTVAIVDDDDLFRESLGGNLENEGFSVLHFDNGADALSAFNEGTAVDLVLLDWKMPEMNGIEVLRQLRADDHAVPVIFLTVLSDQIYEEAALLGGAIDFVEKSRSFAILLKRIELALSGSADAKTQPRRADAQIRIGDLDLNADGKEDPSSPAYLANTGEMFNCGSDYLDDAMVRVREQFPLGNTENQNYS